jgi:catalase
LEKNKVKSDEKNDDLEAYRVDSKNQQLSTNTGVKINDTDNSLRAGPRGPTLMEDFHFREKIMHFDHERIPERVVHARGSGAHGYFQVYKSMSKYTKAKFLQDPEKKTPVFVRFSTVAGSRGSADTVRDVRGFATRFYTEDGNYDLVGNNIPVFFIQDAIKFPDVIHAVKPEQDNEVPQASTAHDTIWNFVTSAPETAHMVMWTMSDRALPRSYRMMDGFGVNTYRFVNEEGTSCFVKFHWRAMLGAHSLAWDETQKIAGKDSDFNRRDLWEAIDLGDYPEYEFSVQIIDEADVEKFDFDVLDATKIWPEELVPLQPVGKMVLNRNPDNFFAETEQVAFCVGNLVPGIDVSDDPLLQGRLFSYLDTQLIRLGGPNFNEIPINRPIAPVVNNQRDGYHRMTINKGKTAYHPNTLNEGYPKPGLNTKEGYVHYPEMINGQKIQVRSETFNDHFSQATLFWNSMTEPEKYHIIKAFHFEVGKVTDSTIRQKVVDMFNNVDNDLAKAIALGVGANPPKLIQRRMPKVSMSKALTQQNPQRRSAKTRKVAILVMDGFNDLELMTTKKALTAEGVRAEVVSQYLTSVKSLNGKELAPDKNFVSVSSVLYDAVYVPGGEKSIDALAHQPFVLEFINEAYKHCKPIAASSEGVALLQQTIVEAKMAFSKTAMSDQGVVTSMDAPDEAFNRSFVDAIAMHRHWGREKTENVPVELQAVLGEWLTKEQ